MSYLLANTSDGLPQYFTIDRKLSGGIGATCFQGDATKALQFARKQDAEQFSGAYYPFLSLEVRPFA